MKVELSSIKVPESDFTHSFIKALDSSLNSIGSKLSISEVASRSGFAFRLIVHKELCPSAMSVFDWTLLEKGAMNCGFELEIVSRLWDEEQYEVERREEAKSLIIKSIDNNISVVVWDLATPEWELVTGYDNINQTYYGISVSGEKAELPFEKLGRREIPILHVLAPVKAMNIDDEEALKNTLDMIINHSSGNEYCERPDYSDGYDAYLVWADAMDNITTDDWESRYYIETYERMRKYAYEYFDMLSLKYPQMIEIAKLYKKVHEELTYALHERNSNVFPDVSIITSIKKHLVKAHEYEKSAVEKVAYIRNHNMIFTPEKSPNLLG